MPGLLSLFRGFASCCIGHQVKFGHSGPDAWVEPLTPGMPADHTALWRQPFYSNDHTDYTDHTDHPQEQHLTTAQACGLS